MPGRPIGTPGRPSRVCPILMYHSIDSVPSGPYASLAVPVETFASHLRCLLQEGYTPLTVSQAFGEGEAHMPLPERPVVLTFDDGLADFYTGALPLLHRHGIPATLYVVTDCVGGRARWLEPQGEGGRPMLSWNELEEIQAAGVECGAHSRTHPALDRLPAPLLEDEIRGSRAGLEDRLGVPVRSFAYPYGYANRSARAAVQRAGFDSACVVDHCLATRESPRLALPRIVVTPQIDERRLLRLVAGRDLTVLPSIRLPLRRLGRSLGGLRAG